MWLVCLYPICAALTLTQSRTGVLGLTLTSLLVALADRKRLRGRPLAVLCRIIFLTSLLVWCFGISLWAMPSGDPVDLTHEMSNRERLLMLDGATRMVATHPLTGYGLGSFESVFPKVMVDAGLQMKSDTVTHPHNEILYVASEGGVVALAGLLILGGVWFWPLVWRLYYAPLHGMCPDTGRWLSGRKGLSSSGWLLPLTGLPVVVHIMLEYPLYLSAPHLLLLLLLFRIGLPEAGLHMCRLPACIHLFVLPLLMVVIAGILSILQAGFTTQRALSRAEAEMNQGLLPVLPSSGWQTLTQAERLELDQHMLSALTPGFLQRPEDTAAFWLWGQRWLAVHNDAEVSAAMMLIAQHRGDSASEERLRVNAARVFVNDPRFIRSGH
ncbi:TPA: O-antigen ligase family protein [Klebsiella oxytoca]|nr:O-antigen ligase family protein [Klebsiella oxytoca]